MGTARFPREEGYAFRLKSGVQLRRSGSSIPTNLAERRGRNGSAGFARFCHFALGSAGARRKAGSRCKSWITIPKPIAES